jgi:hypothetical protein
MSSHLRNKPGVAPMSARPRDLADTFETIAQRLENAIGRVERELTRWADEARASSAENGRTVSRITSHHSAEHTGALHRHDLLCVAPAGACSWMRRIAERLRELDATISADGLPLPALPNVNVRTKEARLGQRINVERSIEWLAQWAYDRGVAPQGTPVPGFAKPYRSDDTGPRTDQTKKEAVCRVLYELVSNGSEADWIRAIRGLAQESYNGGGALEAIVQRIAAGNPDVTPKTTATGGTYWVPRATAGPRAVPESVAFVLNETTELSDSLRRLDRTMRLKCLFSSRDQAPRGTKPEQTFYLAQIKDLSCSGFDGEQMASLIDDGLGGDAAARAKRISESLHRDRDKGRDRRTRHIGPLTRGAAPH